MREQVLEWGEEFPPYPEWTVPALLILLVITEVGFIIWAYFEDRKEKRGPKVSEPTYTGIFPGTRAGSRRGSKHDDISR